MCWLRRECRRKRDSLPGPVFLNELETGIYPLGKSKSLRAQYIEVSRST
jgi:hypothetical protein